MIRSLTVLIKMSCISNLINGKIYHRENKNGQSKSAKNDPRIKLSSIHIAVKGGAVFFQLGFYVRNQLRRADCHNYRLPSIL